MCTIEFRDYKPQYERLRLEKESANVAAQTSKLSKVSIKERVAGSLMHTRSEMLADQEIHLGGADLEDAEDEQERVFGQPEDEEDGTRAFFSRFIQFIHDSFYRYGRGQGVVPKIHGADIGRRREEVVMTFFVCRCCLLLGTLPCV
jgi:hypothetical protein